MTVRVPPRPPTSDRLRDRSTLEQLREQEALIEEARRRARRRRQRYAAVALLAIAVALAFAFVPFVPFGGGHSPGASPSSVSSGQGSRSQVTRAPGDRYSEAPAISANGLFVAFDSHASNLIGADTNGRNDVFVHGMLSRKTTRASVGSRGEQGIDASYVRAISADGRFVVFSSFASNLVAGDTGECNARSPVCSQVFVRNRVTGKTKRVSVGIGGKQPNGDSGEAAISAGGSYVAFTSYASNLVAGDTNTCVEKYPGTPARRQPCVDVFVRDRAIGTTERVSVSSSGEQANGDSGQRDVLAISATGRYVAFSSDASSLVAGDTNTCAPLEVFGGKEKGPCQDVFVHDRATGETERMSVSSAGTQAKGPSSEPSISANGRYVAFSSDASNLVAGDTNGRGDVFVRDRATGKTERLSLSTARKQTNGSSDDPTISADGRFVAFASEASNLVNGDTNNLRDVFARDRATGTTTLVSVAR